MENVERYATPPCIDITTEYFCLLMRYSEYVTHSSPLARGAVQMIRGHETLVRAPTRRSTWIHTIKIDVRRHWSRAILHCTTENEDGALPIAVICKTVEAVAVLSRHHR